MKPLLVAFGGGLALIIVVRLLAPSFGGEMAAAAIAAAIAVGVVAWLGLYYHRDEERDRGSAGDDLYYLGLLFTLCSMSHTLIELVVDAEDAQARFQQLIGSFGIALVSTIAGILGRILLQSGSVAESPPEPEQLPPESTTPATAPAPETEDVTRANQEVAQTMLALRRDLREASNAFVHFTRTTLSHAESVKAHAERVVQDFNTRMDAAALQGVNSTSSAWEQAAARMAAATERLLRQIDQNTASATQRTDAAWQQLAVKSSATAEAARARLDENAEHMATLLGRLAAANRALESLGAGVEAARDSVATLGQQASQAARRVDEQTAATTRTHTAVADGTERVQASVAKTLGETLDKVAALRDNLVEQGRLWRAATEDFASVTAAERQRQAGIADAARRLLDELASGVALARGDIASLGDTMKNAVAEFAAATAAERQHQAGVAGAARSSLYELAAEVANARVDVVGLGETAKTTAAELVESAEQAQERLSVDRQQDAGGQRWPAWLAGLVSRLPHLPRLRPGSAPRKHAKP